MVIQKYDIEFYKGVDVLLPLTLSYSIDSCTFTGELNDRDLTVEYALTVTKDNATKLVTVKIPKSVTSQLTIGKQYVWSLKQTDGNSNETIILSGLALVR